MVDWEVRSNGSDIRSVFRMSDLGDLCKKSSRVQKLCVVPRLLIHPTPSEMHTQCRTIQVALKVARYGSSSRCRRSMRRKCRCDLELKAVVIQGVAHLGASFTPAMLAQRLKRGKLLRK